MGKEQNLAGEGTQKKVEAKAFPDDLEGRKNAILASVNTGLKSVTAFLLPPEGQYISPKDLSTRFKQTFMGTDVGEFHPDVPVNYCLQTLVPRGLVAQEYTIDYFGTSKVVGFGLTSAGQHYGLSSAALALEFESETGESLYPIFGSIGETNDGRMTQFTRAQMLQVLKDSPISMTQADLCRILGVSSNMIKANLQALTRAGVIDYKSFDPHIQKNPIVFSRGGLELKDVSSARNNDTSLTFAIAEVAIKLQEANIYFSYHNIYELLPEEIKKRRGKEPLVAAVKTIVSNLAEQKFFQRVTFKDASQYSSIAIIEKGERVVEGFLGPLEAILTDDSNSQEEIKMRNLRISSNLSQVARKAAEIYYPLSRSYKRKEKEQIIATVERVIFEKTDGITSGDLSAELSLSASSIRNYITILEERGLIGRRNVNGAPHYYPIDISKQ